MKQLFKADPGTFAERLLDWLLHGGGLTEAMHADALARTQQGIHLEQALLDAGLARSDLLRGFLDTKGVYAVPLGDLFAELAVAEGLAFEASPRVHVMPLAYNDELLIGLTDAGQEPPAEVRLGAQTLRFLSIGTLTPFDEEAAGLHQQIARCHPADLAFDAYLVRLGLLDEGHPGLGQHPSLPRLDEWIRYAIERGAPEGDVSAAAAAFVNRPFVTGDRLEQFRDRALVPPIARSYIEASGLLGIRRTGRHITLVAMRMPDLVVLERLMRTFGDTSALAVITTPSAFYKIVDDVFAGAQEPASEPHAPGFGDLQRAHDARAAPEISVRLNALLAEVVRSRASDLHIERYQKRVDVKVRIDGSLTRIETPWLTTENVQAFVTKIKVDASLDIAEGRRPQDGVIRRRFGDHAVDFRVATQPTLWGENAVLRVLDQGAEAPRLDKLGFRPGLLGQFRRLINNPQGLILLVGPTGCGKTTTLYAVLQELKRGEIKILTAEDPIEYAIDGVQQSQINDLIGNTFDRYLRAFLRQDPDVILVGEIRDAATAEMAVRASLTGHLVLSTLHVNDAQCVVRRLVDLGLPPSLIAQTLLCVLSQRLARKVCLRCAHPHVPAAELLRELYPDGPPPLEQATLGRGCEACRRTGYRGRLALMELWAPDDGARALIESGATTEELLRQALGAGMLPLVRDGLDKALKGLTTFEEVRSVVPYEQIVRHLHAQD